MESTLSPLCEIALALASQGFSVLPIKPGGKRPAIASHDGGSGYKDATSDAEKIKQWWEEMPSANVAIATGVRSGIVVLDFDGPIGVETLATLDPPDTLEVATPRGGIHLYFSSTDPDLGCRAGMLPGMDSRGNGGYVLAPGSVRDDQDGRTYYVTDTARRILPLPDEYRKFFLPKTHGVKFVPLSVNNERAKKWVSRGLEGAAIQLAQTDQGSRNATLNSLAYRFAGYAAAGLVPLGDVESMLFAAAVRSGLPKSEVSSTLESGIKAGIARPLEPQIREDYAKQKSKRTRKALPPKQEDAQPVDPETVTIGEIIEEHHKTAVHGDEQRGIGRVTHAGYRQATCTEQYPWVADLDVEGNKKASTLANAKKCMVGLVGAGLVLNEFNREMQWRACPPWENAARFRLERSLNDQDMLSAVVWIDDNLGIRFSKETIWDALCLHAQSNPVNTLHEHIDRVIWDRQPRIDDWLTDYCGAPNTEHNRLVGRWFLIQAARRALFPGCKADHVLVLEGAQGIGKSSILRALAGDDFFGDPTLDIHDKDTADKIGRLWVVELAELDAITRKEWSAVKAWIVQTDDRYRPPYGRTVLTVPRHCVFAATTNTAQYLTDDTGNRRFWAVRCGVVGPMRPMELEIARPQLLAEAAYRARDGERYWPATPEEIDLFTVEQQLRGDDDDPWMLKLDRFLRDRSDVVTINQCMVELDIDLARVRGNDVNRIAKALRKLGWQRRRAARPDRHWVYFRE